MTSLNISMSVAGESGLTRDLVTHVLVSAGFPQAAPSEADVAVLVDPNPDQLDEARDADAPIVVVTSSEIEHDQVTALVCHGADAVVHTQAAATELEDAVVAVAEGGSVIPPAHLRAVLEHLRAAPPKPEERCTAREMEILRCIDTGASVKQTALTLGISAKTVENLQSRLFRKLGVRNRAQAVSWAHANGLLSSDTNAKADSP